MNNNHDTTIRTLNRPAAKGLDTADFRFRKAVEALAPTLYYAQVQVHHLDAPIFQRAGLATQAYYITLAEDYLRSPMPAIEPITPPVQPVVPHCMPRNVVLTHVPPYIACGKVLMIIGPNQRPS